MANSGFPHHTIASLRQVGMMGLTPLHMKISYMLTVTSSWSRCSLGSPHTHTSARNLLSMHSGSNRGVSAVIWRLRACKHNKMLIGKMYPYCGVAHPLYGVRLRFLFLVVDDELDATVAGVAVASASCRCWFC